jgi:nucleotide-binding universal stress UspA family protein
VAFHRILCPIDFSPGADEALRLAAGLARDANASLVLLHVQELPTWAFAGHLAPEVIAQLVEVEETELAKWKRRAAELGAREVATRYLTGAAWDQIVAAARDDREIDLVVMGTRGRTGLSRALLGSVAERVVRHAPCPVMVVRSRAGGS